MHIDTLNDCRVVVNLLITLYDFLHLYPFFFSSSVGHLHESLPYIYLKCFKFMVTILCFYLICCYEFYHQVKILILTWARVLLSIGEARFICFLNLCKAFFSWWTKILRVSHSQLPVREMDHFMYYKGRHVAIWHGFQCK